MSFLTQPETLTYKDSMCHDLLVSKLEGKTLGDKITIVYPPRFKPQCWYCTSTNNRCRQQPMFKYIMAYDNVYDVCSKTHHRHKAIDREENNVVLYVLRQVSKSDEERDVRLHFRVIAMNVSEDHDITCPLISNVKDPIQMKQELIEKSNEMYAIEAVQRDIIDTLHHKLYLYRYRLQKSEESLIAHQDALRFMRTNVDFVPGNRKLFESSQTVCALCDSVMHTDDSSTLYECTHSFHHECIHKWFDNKSDMKCPTCKVRCDVDRYFVYNRYVQSTSSAVSGTMLSTLVA